MKPNKITLEVGQSLNLGGKLRRLKVLAADGPILVKTPTETAPLVLGETLTLETPSERTEITNQHGASNTLNLLLIGSGEGDISSPSASVSINNQPKVSMLADSEANGLAQVTTAAGVNSIAGNVNRRVIMIHAGQTNTGRLWIGGSAEGEGIPLDADDTIELRVKGAISIWATNAGDKINALEVV